MFLNARLRYDADNMARHRSTSETQNQFGGRQFEFRVSADAGSVTPESGIAENVWEAGRGTSPAPSVLTLFSLPVFMTAILISE